MLNRAGVDALQKLLKIGARAEALAGAGQHDGAHLGVDVAFAQRAGQLNHHGRTERVALAGIVERDRRYAAGDRYLYERHSSTFIYKPGRPVVAQCGTTFRRG